LKLTRGTRTPDQGHESVSSPKQRTGFKRSRQPTTTTGNGTVIQSYAGSLGRWAFYGVAVLMALGALCGFLAFIRPATPVQLTTDTSTTAQHQEAGAFAQAYLAAWLTATTSDHTELDRYTNTTGTAITGTTPTEYRDLTVVSTEESGNLSTVIISASLQTTSNNDEDGTSTDAGEDVTSWTPYWYQVAVQSNDDGEMAPLGLPAPISMPAISTAPQLGYPSRVANREVEATVADFMTAYLTGQGDVTRYVSPETTINAITPAYWTDAAVRSLASSEEVPDRTPTAGQSAQVLVDVNLTRENTTKPAQYVLDLKARDGRWEISSLRSASGLAN
jgi:hypothetical protein